jgi:hypothetical protein
MSDEKESIFGLLGKVQAELKAPKGQRNEFGKYNYRSMEDINEAVKPILAKYGLHMIITDELVQIGDRYYVKATACIWTSGGEFVGEATGYAREEETKKGMDASQITGACSSYARKYAANGLLLLDDTRDADATNKGAEGKETTLKAITEQQAADLRALMEEVKAQEDKFLAYFKVGCVEELPAGKYKQAVQMLQAKVK